MAQAAGGRPREAGSSSQAWPEDGPSTQAEGCQPVDDRGWNQGASLKFAAASRAEGLEPAQAAHPIRQAQPEDGPSTQAEGCQPVEPMGTALGASQMQATGFELKDYVR